jgi:3-hydroxyisobutyrate dehydrogenase
MAELQTVAVLGAGSTMGLPIAANLARAGFWIRAWNRTAEKAEPLRTDGAELFATPAEAADGADAIITILADKDAVLETIEQAAGDQSTAVWLQLSTIGERGTERCMKFARERGLEFVDAPVLGTKQPAEQGKLVVLASGPSELREALTPLFDAIGQRTMWLGEAGLGTRLKLATNTWILSIVEGTAETMALAEGLGVDPRQVLEAVSGGPLDLPYLQMKGKAIIERDFEPSFKLSLAAKDASLVAEAAGDRGMELPLVETIGARLRVGARHHGDEDMIATYLTSAPTVSRAGS